MAALNRVVLGTSPILAGASGSMSFATALALNGATDTVEWIFRTYEAVTITHGGFRASTRTGTPPAYRLSFQGVSNGIPDGVIKGGGSPASATFTPPASTAWNNTFQWVQLANSYTTTPGELLSMVVDYSSGTVDGSNNLSFTTDINGFHGRNLFPYAIQNDAGSRTRTGQLPIFGYKSSTKSYGYPFSAINSTTFDNSGASRCLTFTLPFYCKIIGAVLRMSAPAAAKTFVIKIREGTTERATTGTIDTDDLRTNAQDSNVYEAYFTNTTPYTFLPGVQYNLCLETADASINLAMACAQANSAQDAAVNGDGNYYLSTYNGATYTPDTTQRPLTDLILSDISTGGLFVPVE